VFPAVLAFFVRRHTQESQIWLDAGKRLTARESFKQLFAERPKIVLTCVAFTAAAMCGYWGLFTWIPNYLASPVAQGGRGLDILSSTAWLSAMPIGAAAGFVSFGYVADKIGRRPTFIVYFLAAAACVPVFVLIESPTLMFVFGAVMALFGTGFYSGFGPTFAELFPTEIRAFAQGFIYNIGRATSALAPLMIGLLSTSVGVGLAMASAASFYLIAAVIVLFFLPETRGRELTGVADSGTQVDLGKLK